jgi:GDPmannose 4,6-dehydratase
MLQQDEPEEFVIATGHQYSVRKLYETAALESGFGITWQGIAEYEVGIVSGLSSKEIIGIKNGDIIMRVDAGYYRPAEAETPWVILPRTASNRAGQLNHF